MTQHIDEQKILDTYTVKRSQIQLVSIVMTHVKGGWLVKFLVAAGRTTRWWVNICASQICFSITSRTWSIFLKIFASWMIILYSYICIPDNQEFVFSFQHCLLTVTFIWEICKVRYMKLSCKKNICSWYHSLNNHMKIKIKNHLKICCSSYLFKATITGAIMNGSHCFLFVSIFYVNLTLGR